MRLNKNKVQNGNPKHATLRAIVVSAKKTGEWYFQKSILTQYSRLLAAADHSPAPPRVLEKRVYV